MIDYRPNGPFKKGHPVPQQWREAVSKAHKGERSTWTVEARKKSSESHKKLWKNPEYRAMICPKLSKALKGRKFSEASKRRMSESQWLKNGGKHPFLGKKLPHLSGENNPAKRLEVRAKISQRKREEMEKHPERWLNVKLAKLGRASRPQWLLFNIVRQKFPDAQLNYHIPNTRRFADVGIPSERVDFEFDGEYWHQDKEADDARDNEITSVGWSVFRIKQHHLDGHDVESLLGIGDCSFDGFVNNQE